MKSLMARASGSSNGHDARVAGADAVGAFAGHVLADLLDHPVAVEVVGAVLVEAPSPSESTGTWPVRAPEPCSSKK